MIRYLKDNRQIVTLTFDMRGRGVNVINHELVGALLPVLDLLESDKRLAGVILASGKRSFLAGGDLDYLHQTADVQRLFDYAEQLRRIFRRLERLSAPVVAAINGAALGSGYELTLACHHRVALDTPHTLIGLPEVHLGMIPGGGSIARLTWLLGMERAFEVLSSGKQFHVKEALQKGLVDEVVASPQALMERARAYILSKPDLSKPWDRNGFPPDFANPRHPKTAQTIFALSAKTLSETKGNYPAVHTLLQVMTEGAMVDFDTARRIESRHFTALLTSRECRNLTKAHWYDTNKIHNGLSRPKGFGRFRARKIGLIGAGIMGAGLAHTAALVGIEVVLKDVSVAIAQQGKDGIRTKLEKLVAGRKMSQEQAQAIVARIQVTEAFRDLEDCDLVIETVFENRDLKIRVARELEQYLNRYAFIASNSATLSISDLAQACVRPRRFIGMHFFDPVVAMPLVELIAGQETDDETLARAFDFVRQLRKTPVVVQDRPGFFVSRVVRMYLLEAARLLLEGQAPSLIENLALQAGMRTAPLALADRVSLRQLMETEKALASASTQADSQQALAVFQHLLEKQRTGRSCGQGFYDYQDRKPQRLWPELSQHYPQASVAYPLEDLRDRLIFIQCLEAVECLENQIIGSSAEANLAGIQGWGFIPFSGGPIQFINDYGLPKFVARATYLAQHYGPRFQPSSNLKHMAEQGADFI